MKKSFILFLMLGVSPVMAHTQEASASFRVGLTIVANSDKAPQNITYQAGSQEISKKEVLARIETDKKTKKKEATIIVKTITF